MYITTIAGGNGPQQLSMNDMFEQVMDFDFDMNHELEIYRAGSGKGSYTMTRWYDYLPDRLVAGLNLERKIRVLKDFNTRHAGQFDGDRKQYYNFFKIPKQSGGLRTISEPCAELQATLGELKVIFENEFFARHHAAAHAYVTGRSTITAVQVHQRNKSKWFLKTDLSGFFPSTNLDFVMKMLGVIYPFCELVKVDEGRAELEKALDLCFLDGGLPMGTVISPMLTNLIMIPFDHEFSKWLRSQSDPAKSYDGKGRTFAYTRYADDMHISCGINFQFSVIVTKMKSMFEEMGAPYEIKKEKTHYGSNAGQNWILGVMLNKDNRITIGHKKRARIEAMVFNYLKDRANGAMWNLEDLQYLRGMLSYYDMVDHVGMDALIVKYNKKMNVDTMKLLAADLGAA